MYWRIVLFCFLGFGSLLYPQEFIKRLNLQFHYDFRRAHPTTTLEYFGTDRLGFTFFFADFNFNHWEREGFISKRGGLSDVYFEFMRYFKIYNVKKMDVNFTVQ